MVKIKTIELANSFEAYKDNKDNQLSVLEPVSKINIFVGANNSGKSRFMRILSRQKEYNVLSDDLNINEFNLKIESILKNLFLILKSRKLIKVNDFHELSINVLKPLPKYVNLKNDSYQKIREAFKKWSEFPAISQWEGVPILPDQIKGQIRSEIIYESKNALQILEQVPVFNMPKTIYLPVLRGLRPIDKQQSDLYAERTYSDYFSDNEDTNLKEIHPEVFTGLSFYRSLTSMLLGKNSDRKIIAAYQEFISKKLFEGKPIELIPNQNDKVVVVKIGDEKEQPIFNLGDGIQSVIMLTFLPYTIQEPSIFFIEEPELFLHPGLQRKILDYYSTIKNHTFFITTHSNHFLDLTIDFKDISIFTFQKRLKADSNNDEVIPSFVVESIDCGNSSSLELLGVRNSSVFLVNATIWVEGITDRWYLRKMLEEYMKYLSKSKSLPVLLEEDVHYSFVEYSGSNITHWSFLDYEKHPIEVKRLCARSLVIIDEDGGTKLKRKEELQNILKERLIILPVREIENSLPYPVIKAVLLEYEGTPERKLPAIEKGAYNKLSLGTFIEEHILGGEFKRKGGYQDQSGTIKSKVDFCDRSLSKIKYSDIAPEMQKVIKDIYEFILSQNQ